MIPEYIKLSSGAVEAVFAENRYRGTRFDRAGEIVSLKFRGFEYFGKWTDCPDPSFHDCISGVPEEFAQIGYDAAPVGGVFLKIGVGALVKPDSAPYNFRRTYPVSDAGGRRSAFSEDSAEFVHGMDTNIGYAYEYTKKIRLETDGISVSHRLEIRENGQSKHLCTTTTFSRSAARPQAAEQASMSRSAGTGNALPTSTLWSKFRAGEFPSNARWRLESSRF